MFKRKGMQSKKSLLVILDGWGLGQEPKADAIQQASTPFFDHLMLRFPNAALITYGLEVGLPEGQMGNSEVGHLNIGAGRVVYQELARINKAIKDDTLQNEPVLKAALLRGQEEGRKFHLLGLLSDGGVHSHIEHLIALSTIISNAGITNLKVHGFLDGRDTDPFGGAAYLEYFNSALQTKGIKISTIIGRYYAMDRDNRWERIKKAYDLLVSGVGQQVDDLAEAIRHQYTLGLTDEFMIPMVIDTDAIIEEGDVVLFANFRTDRPRQLTKALTQQDFPTFDMKALPLHFFTMTEYDETYRNVHVIYTKDKLAMTIGEAIAQQGLSQLRIAETEKYPHVTFFFSGGREEAFEHEQRILIPSPKVATYDLEPEMSAEEITTHACDAIRLQSPDFICLNFANTDMVGHTGDFQAAMVAATTVDHCLKTLVDCALEHDYEIIIIADHGNSDYMINEDGSPNTAHTTNPVPIIYVSNQPRSSHLKSGKLADIAPTLLHLMGLPIPKEMTGNILIEN